MATFNFDHIHYRTPDPEGMAAFFEKMFGAQVIRTTVDGKPRIDLKLDGTDIFLAPVAAGGGVNAPPTTPYQGLDHIGLTVKNLDAAVKELKEKGAEFSMEPNNFRPGVRISFMRGPQGISIELLERTPV